MSDYLWKWEKGEGAYHWLRDKSGTVSRGRKRASSTIGLLEFQGRGWVVTYWDGMNDIGPELAVLPADMYEGTAKDVAKVILITEYHNKESS
jgi:hypothetical protein